MDSPQPTQTPAAPEAQPPSGWRALGLSAWVRDLIISIGISFFFIIFLYEPVKVEGTSMLPGLQDQERIFINKFVYRWEPISRGDIVVFRYPRDTSKSFIKRVIAVGGDRIVIDKGRVYLNGRLLREPYVPREYVDMRSTNEIVVPDGEFFVMGDHRSMSDDSRDFGPVDDTYITGKAVFVYWPMDKLGLLR
jgi:signal peptidase I